MSLDFRKNKTVKRGVKRGKVSRGKPKQATGGQQSESENTNQASKQITKPIKKLNIPASADKSEFVFLFILLCIQI